MGRLTRRVAVVALVAAVLAGSARADAMLVDARQLEPGANSFTEGQARSRIGSAGFVNVRRLQVDEHGFWRGRATRRGSGGEEEPVMMDFRGRVARDPDTTPALSE